VFENLRNNKDAALSDPHADDTQIWREKIRTAAADDAALLRLVHEVPAPALKIAVIESLTHEESCRLAAHDFREGDKRVYRAAKSRWDHMRNSREATAAARELIASARALLEHPSVPVNRVVELDHGWAALDARLIDPALVHEFGELNQQLTARVREHGAHTQQVTRWLSSVDSAMTALRDALPAIAEGTTPPPGAETLAVALLDLVQSPPDMSDERCAEKTAMANRLLALAASVVERAKFLYTLPAFDTMDEAAERACIEQWRAFPEMSEGMLHAQLATRFADWRNAGMEARQREHGIQSAEERAKRVEQNRQRAALLVRDIEAAEAAQAEGHLADLVRHLATVDNHLKRGTVSAHLNHRIEALRRELRRLQDWQRWSGNQGREALVSEAQVLAAASEGKVSIKAHGEAIHKLRERWKELDKTGGMSSHALWLAFDGALEKAYVPVAAHLAKQKAARDDNLAARNDIIAGLAAAAEKFFAPAVEGATSSQTQAPDWRAVSRTLEEAQVAWRKLGPVEHTVPHKALKGEGAVTARYKTAVAALETPLKAAYAGARTQRDQLVAEARKLVGSDVQARDVIDKVRQLQTRWQTVAKTQPLPRRDENALWMAFKAATDAIFTARDAARAAKEAEANATQQARVDIIERVAALARGEAAVEIKRALTQAETDWRAAPEAPRPQVARLEARYRAARDAATQRIGELAAHAQQARFDALLAAVSLCRERESAGNASGDLDARWNAITSLPDAWKNKLAARFSAKSDATTNVELPDTLLNLEAACSIESPPEFQAARQRLKILALKTAMEGRQAVATTPADIERWLLAAAASPRPDDVSQQRLEKIIAAVRNRRLV